MRGKKGLSAVVGTILLILLTIAIVIIIAAIVFPFAKKGLGRSSECIDYRDYFSFEERFEFGVDVFKLNCVDDAAPTNILHGASIRARTVDVNTEQLTGLELNFIKKGGESVRVRINNQSSTEGVKLFGGATTLIVPASGGVNTYVFDAGNLKYDKVEVYPVLENERVCESSAEIDLIDCQPNVALGGP